MELKDGKKTVYAKDGKAWRSWLQKNGLKEQNVWLIIYRKNAAKPSVYYDEAVDEALCFGWIDSKANKRDDESFYQFFARRNPKSKWSKVNKDKVARLLKQGRIAPEGQAAIEAAKANGAWVALDEIEALTLPADLKKAFEKNAEAEKNFTAFPRSAKRGILEWICNAKGEATKMKRINETVQLAEKNIRANQYIKK